MLLAGFFFVLRFFDLRHLFREWWYTQCFEYNSCSIVPTLTRGPVRAISYSLLQSDVDFFTQVEELYVRFVCFNISRWDIWLEMEL